MKNFIKETEVICENYENEIELLISRLNELEHAQKSFQNNNLRVNTVIEEEFESNQKISFLRQMKTLTDKDISFMDISNVYNEKISELFEENEKLQVMIKNQQALENENVNLQKLNEEKESSIKNINEIYQEKFSELFVENEKIYREIEELKKTFEMKENKYLIENKNLKEIVVENNSIKIENEERVKNYEEKLKTIEELLIKKDLELVEKEEIKNSEKIKFKENLKKLEEENKKLMEESSLFLIKIQDAENQTEKLKKEFEEKIQKLEKEFQKSTNDLQAKEAEIISLKNSILEYESKLNLNKNSSTNMEEKLKEIKCEYDMNNANLTTQLSKQIEKAKRLDSENETLKEIITKDQITLKELKDFKTKTEINNVANNIIIEENQLLRNEIKLFKQRCEEEMAKIQDLNKKLDEKEEEKQKVGRDVALLEKKIENLNKLIEDYKEKIKILRENLENSEKVLDSSGTSTPGRMSINESFIIDTEGITSQVAPGESARNENSTESEASNIQADAQVNQINQTNHNKYQVNLLKILFSDYIYYLYLYDNALNTQKIVEIILNNFSFYLNTIFNRKENLSLPSSFIHEFLENLVLKINDTYICNKIEEFSKRKDFNINTIFKEDNIFSIPLINHDEISIDDLKKVSEVVEKNNCLSLTNSLTKKEKSLEDIIYIFMHKYKKLLDLGGKYFSNIGIKNINAFIIKDVGQIVASKIEKYRLGITDQIRTLIEYIVVNIHSGKLMNNGAEIYNFKEYSAQFAKRELNKGRDTLHVKGIVTSSEGIDNIISTFKNESKTLTDIIFENVFDHKSDYTLGKLSISTMLSCNNLTSLSIINSNLSENHLLHVVKLIDYLKSLKTFDLSKNNIRDSGVKILCESLKLNKNILSINISSNNITERGGFYIADAMIKNKSLQNLDLSNNSINDTGLSSLLTVLTNNNDILKTLNLANNQFLPQDFKNVADLISSSTSLISMDLSLNRIDQQSAYSFGLALKQAKSLDFIKLNSIDLNEEAAPLLLKNLSDSRISEVHLDDNPFGEIGAIIFANVLKLNKNLKIVSFKRAQLTPMFLICLSKVILFNATIEQINLEENSFNEDSLGLLTNSIKNKNIKIHFSKTNIGPKLYEAFKHVENFVFN